VETPGQGKKKSDQPTDKAELRSSPTKCAVHTDDQRIGTRANERVFFAFQFGCLGFSYLRAATLHLALFCTSQRVRRLQILAKIAPFGLAALRVRQAKLRKRAKAAPHSLVRVAAFSAVCSWGTRVPGRRPFQALLEFCFRSWSPFRFRIHYHFQTQLAWPSPTHVHARVAHSHSRTRVHAHAHLWLYLFDSALRCARCGQSGTRQAHTLAERPEQFLF